MRKDKGIWRWKPLSKKCTNNITKNQKPCVNIYLDELVLTISRCTRDFTQHFKNVHIVKRVLTQLDLSK